MILQHIVALFDEELARLARLREIVAGLQRPSSVASVTTLMSSLDVPVETQAATTGQPEAAADIAPASPRRTRTRSFRARRPTRTMSHAREESTALRGSIPKGPVVVLPGQVAPRPVAAAPATAKPELGSLGLMIRALHLDGA